MEEQYWIRSCGKVLGPFAAEELRARARRGGFSRAHQVSRDGHSWQRATAFPDLFPAPTTPQARIREERIAARELNREPAEVPNEAAPHADAGHLLDQMGGYPMDSTHSWEAPDSGDTESLWHYSHNATEHGPVSFSELQDLASTEQLAPGDLVWSEGMPDWTEAYRIPGVFTAPDGLAPTRAATALEPRMSSPAEPLATSAMAVGSFVLGLLGTTLLFFVGSIVAVVFGHVALRQIRASANTLGGRGMAIAGLVMGYTVIIATTTVGVVVICVYLMQGILAGPQ